MKAAFAILVGVAMVLAAPPAPVGNAVKGSCTYSANEKLNLGHNHDVNTGQILVGGKIVKGPKIGGSGCSPAWAVGGAITDKTPTPTKQGAAKKPVEG
jgi:hypothetical protein